jgi:hypothetical protein
VSKDEASNQSRHEELKREISIRSLVFLPGEGQQPTNGWPTKPSVLVLGLSLEAPKVMGRKCEFARKRAEMNFLVVISKLCIPFARVGSVPRTSPNCS